MIRPLEIINASTSGAVTADGVRRLDSALTEDTPILVLELGANGGLRGVAIDRIEGSLAEIIERAQARGFEYSCHSFLPRWARTSAPES